MGIDQKEREIGGGVLPERRKSTARDLRAVGIVREEIRTTILVQRMHRDGLVGGRGSKQGLVGRDGFAGGHVLRGACYGTYAVFISHHLLLHKEGDHASVQCITYGLYVRADKRR
mgnify:CR=1 FL=1